MQEFMHLSWDGPMSEDDKLWLCTWDQQELVAENERLYSDEDLEDEAPELEDDYDSWKAQELKVEALNREMDISGMTKKSEIIAALRAWDRDRDQEEGDE